MLLIKQMIPDWHIISEWEEITNTQLEALALGFSEESNSSIGLLLWCIEREAYVLLQEIFGPAWRGAAAPLWAPCPPMWVLASGTWTVVRGKNNSWEASSNAAKAPAKRNLWLVFREAVIWDSCLIFFRVDDAKPGLWWP